MDSSATAAALGNASLGQGRVTLRELCCLFCCPPLPSAIVSKLAFTPPEPSYSIQIDNDDNTHKFQFVEGRAEWPHGFEELKDIEVFYTRSSRNQKVACMMVRPFGENARYTILFSHANAVDLGHMASFFYVLGYRLNCNVFSYDYSGYGCSSGKATERNLYADIQCAYEALLSRYDVVPEKIVLYGQSIGTVPTIDLASKHSDIGAVILHSPLMSGMRVAFPATKRTWCFDAFPSIEKIVKVASPTLVIHGVEDEVIDFSHGLAIHEKCPSSVEPLWVHGAGHNDIELSPAFLIRLRDFIDNEAGPANRHRLEQERRNGTASTSVSQSNGVAAQVVQIMQMNKNGSIASANGQVNTVMPTGVHRAVVENDQSTITTTVPAAPIISEPVVDTVISNRRSSTRSDKRKSSSSTKYGSTSTPPNA